MPYLLLVIGLALAAYALFRFFLKAGPAEIKAAFLTATLVALAIALFYMAVTGRLPAAIALVAAIIPFIPALLKKLSARKAQTEEPAKPPASNTPMTREEALKILGLNEEADTKTVNSAYKALMKKVHPDQEGSAWLAAKLNEARDFLLNKK
ncbi:MAG: DnaJ domain-containing protein [Alphaproteobacteria bacterium]|nr:DnaJ domain-containing protein [Alphaproteobacteria bacterium]MCD8520293.1 DnaJ domain-containing protein [Alphaproteobacteria bacterium]MCD8570189.1 DnaJ domain-containing protein [Alphaproteobacteria bacterium]